jgi:hypothetical protein
MRVASNADMPMPAPASKYAHDRATTAGKRGNDHQAITPDHCLKRGVNRHRHPLRQSKPTPLAVTRQAMP